MPFTGSHPAAVLPLLRVLEPSALIIGSMVPDLGYYLPLPVSSPSMHTLPGIVTSDLGAGLLCLAGWQLLVAPVLLAAAPHALWGRLQPPRPVRSTRCAALVVISVCVGAATHVLWDEFTHPHRFGTAHVAWLAAGHGPLPGYQWAQYASGVVGAAVLVVAFGHHLRTTNPTPGHRVLALPLSASLISGSVIVTAALGGAICAVWFGVTGGEPLRHVLFLAATWGGGAGLCALLLACAVLRPRVRVR